MNFFENICEVFGINPKSESVQKCIMIGDNAVYLEGIVKLESFSFNQVSLLTKKGRITVCGEKLSIKKFCLGDMGICGKITEIKRENFIPNT